jgi:serpin B
MTRTSLLTLASFLSFSLVACGSSSEPPTLQVAKSEAARVLDPQVAAADSATFAADNEAFALDAYHKMAAANANLVFSPASISIALAMTYAGAAGTTASEMAAALHFSLPPERLHPAFDALDLALASRGEGKLGADGGPMRVDVVNAAWAERTFTFLPTYLDILATSYGAGINLLDFINAADPSRRTINAWVASQTNDKIQDLLPEGSVDSMTRLVLTNAVYLNAAWKTPFDPHDSYDGGSFTLLDNTTVTARMMNADLGGIPAVQGAGFVAASLPYDDERLSFLLVVPDAGTFTDFETALDQAKLDAIVASLTPQAVILSMPPFKIETGQALASLLQGLGMTSAFTPGVADFSGMDGANDLYIAAVIHKAYIAVAEKGTEAAAATGVVMGVTSAPMGLYVTANRPFLFFLRDEPTGAILFMGRVLNPKV